MKLYPCGLGALLALAATLPLLAQRPGSPEAVWEQVRNLLTGPNGATVFAESLQYALLPPPEVGKWTGTVVSASPPENPSEALVSMSDTGTPEVRLMLEDRDGEPDGLHTSLAEGTRIQFSGVAVAYRQDPFQLTLECEVDGKDTGVEIVDRPAAK